MRLHDLKPNPGAKTRRKRVGRGPGSGRGKTSTRGHKGQGSRAGSSTRASFEGGQMPYIRRLPKRGFNNARTRVEYLPVNLAALEEHFEAGATVNLEAILAHGLANGRGAVRVKILGQGKLTKKLAVKAHAYSAPAKAAIEAAGGSCEVIGQAPQASKEASADPAPTSEEPAEAPAEETPAEETPAEEADAAGDKPAEE
jgi:large subunit ribosomal protein L15